MLSWICVLTFTFTWPLASCASSLFGPCIELNWMERMFAFDQKRSIGAIRKKKKHCRSVTDSLGVLTSKNKKRQQTEYMF